MKTITPREVIKNGKTYWRIIVPKDLRDGSAKRLFYDTKLKAEAKAKALTAARGDVAQGFHRLSQPHQGLLLVALDRMGGDAERLLKVVDDHLRTHQVLNSKLISQVVAECLDAKEAAGLRLRYRQTLKCSLNNLANWTTDAPIATVNPHIISEWLNGNDWSAGTRKGYLTDARTLFAFALKRGYVASNPALGVDKPTLEDAAPGIHTVAEVEHLLQTCLQTDPGLIGYLAPLYFGGFRPTEAENFTKKHIHDGLIEITPENSKTRRRRFIHINDTLAEWLKVRRIQFSPTNLKRRLLRLRKAASEPANPNKRPKPFPWPHDVLRHSFCSYGLPVFGATKIAEWAGHSEQVLFAHYRERVKPEDAAKYWALRP